MHLIYGRVESTRGKLRLKLGTHLPGAPLQMRSQTGFTKILTAGLQGPAMTTRVGAAARWRADTLPAQRVFNLSVTDGLKEWYADR